MRRRCEQIAALRERPTALFCANDLMAIGAMDTAREVGLALPDDLALAGYDDIEAAAFLTPSLTTVLNPAHELGTTAGRLLLERMSGYRGPRREIVIPHRLVKRESGLAVGDRARRPRPPRAPRRRARPVP